MSSSHSSVRVVLAPSRMATVSATGALVLLASVAVWLLVVTTTSGVAPRPPPQSAPVSPVEPGEVVVVPPRPGGGTGPSTDRTAAPDGGSSATGTPLVAATEAQEATVDVLPVLAAGAADDAAPQDDGEAADGSGDGSERGAGDGSRDDGGRNGGEDRDDVGGRPDRDDDEGRRRGRSERPPGRRGADPDRGPRAPNERRTPTALTPTATVASVVALLVPPLRGGDPSPDVEHGRRPGTPPFGPAYGQIVAPGRDGVGPQAAPPAPNAPSVAPAPPVAPARPAPPAGPAPQAVPPGPAHRAPPAPRRPAHEAAPRPAPETARAVPRPARKAAPRRDADPRRPDSVQPDRPHGKANSPAPGGRHGRSPHR
jgi:putative serine protease PepD